MKRRAQVLLSDLFHADVPDEFIARVFAVMALAPQHTFQLLTKRHARMRSLLSSVRFADLYHRAICDAADWNVRQPAVDAAFALIGDVCLDPLPNVWLGVSVEDQHWADIRIPVLLDTPAAVRWISAEPLLGPVDLRYLLLCTRCNGRHIFGSCPEHPAALAAVRLSNSRTAKPRPALDWVVVGGESGTGARPMHPQWARDIRDQCAAAGVPFLFKQWGEWLPLNDRPGAIDVEYVRPGKKRAGRELDGRTHDGYPAPAGATA